SPGGRSWGGGGPAGSPWWPRRPSGWRPSACSSTRHGRSGSSGFPRRRSIWPSGTPSSGTGPTATRGPVRRGDRSAARRVVPCIIGTAAGGPGPRPSQVMNAAERTAILARRSGSNFYYSFLFLPRRKREAIYALYAFCRTVDDAVDQGPQNPGEQRKILGEWRAELGRAYEGQPSQPIAVHLAEVVRAFPVPRQHLEAILDGVEMDVEKRRYASFEELFEYCYRVAAAVGLASIEIFGYTDPRTRDYAVNLGIALQLTNIVRDLGTDAERGRIYLPLDELRRFGYPED